MMQLQRKSPLWHPLVASVLMGVLGCVEPLSPDNVKGLYVLQSVGANPLPALMPTTGNWQYRVVADTVVLRKDGSGVHVRWSQSFQSGTAEPAPTRWEIGLGYRIAGSDIEITMICPPNALCTAGPHMIARRDGDGLRVEAEGTVLQYRETLSPF